MQSRQANQSPDGPTPSANPPRSVLFACGLNSLRSPMAAALFAQIFGRAIPVASAGARKGELDPFAVAAMAEIGLDIARHKPITFEELEELDERRFDLIVTLAPEAHHRALEISHVTGAGVEYWPTVDPSAVEGNREQRLDAYRTVRDQLLARIRERFLGRSAAKE
jgi:protein-tyrosine-phosphatase